MFVSFQEFYWPFEANALTGQTYLFEGVQERYVAPWQILLYYNNVYYVPSFWT